MAPAQKRQMAVKKKGLESYPHYSFQKSKEETKLRAEIFHRGRRGWKAGLMQRLPLRIW